MNADIGSMIHSITAKKYEPFDLKLALPDGTDRSDITRYNPRRG
jgi:hypothetical protein